MNLADVLWGLFGLMHLTCLLLKFDEAGLSYIKLIGDVKGNIINIIIIPSR